MTNKINPNWGAFKCPQGHITPRMTKPSQEPVYEFCGAYMDNKKN